MKILFVESDERISSHVILMLEHSGNNVTKVSFGWEAIDFATVYNYDLVLMNTKLSDMDGVKVVSELRNNKINVPIVALTKDDSTETKLRFFGLGGDDYITMPFHREEMIARILAVFRRSNGHDKTTIKIGEITVNLSEKKAYDGDVPITLTNKEYQVLELLFIRNGQTLTREMFIEHIYEHEADQPELQMADVLVYRIRKKIGKHSDIIETVRERGYRVKV